MTGIAAACALIGGLGGAAFGALAAGTVGAVVGLAVGAVLCGTAVAVLWVPPGEPIDGPARAESVDVMCYAKGRPAHIEAIREEGTGRYVEVTQCSLRGPGHVCDETCLQVLHDGAKA